MSINPGKRLLHRAAAAVSLLLISAGPGLTAAEAPLPFGIGQASRLRHLPAGRDDLMFRGEIAHRSFSVFLTPNERDQTKTFQLGLKNTVALLPERSSLRLTVNGRPLAPIAMRSPNTLSIVPIAIPSGSLTAGANQIDIDVTMAHRVDCSIAATYELWTALDPAQTGLLVPAAPDEPIHSVAEVAGEALATDGTARLRLRTIDAADAASVTRAARFIDALVRRAGLSRPIVETGAGAGSGPGVDIMLRADRSDEAMEGLRVIGREDGVTFARTAAGRLTLIVAGQDEADLDSQVSAFASKAADRPGTEVHARVDEGAQLSFADLGFQSVEFTGRRYAAALDVTLPPDFYSANYGKARLVIEGSHATDLEPGSELVFRVNGTPASSLSLGNDRDGILNDEAVELPLRFFRPGHNEIAIEGITPTAADRECTSTSAPAKPRLSISGHSRFEFPAFAHLALAPQISGAWSQRPIKSEGLHVYLPSADSLAVGSGLTVLANMAAHAVSPVDPSVHVGAPSAADVPGLVVTPFADLPIPLSTALQARVTGSASVDPVQSNQAETSSDGLVPASGGPLNPPGPRSLFDQFGRLVRSQTIVDVDAAQAGWARLVGRETALDTRSVLGRAKQLLQAGGYALPANDRTHSVPFTARTILVAAVAPDPRGGELAGIPVPHLADSAAQWLIVTAQDPTVLRAGLDRMTADRHWLDLQGDLVSLDVDKGTVATAEPSRLIYIRPDHLALSEIRPILGGLVSNNIELSLALLAALITLLGVTTHALVRRTGAR